MWLSNHPFTEVTAASSSGVAVPWEAKAQNEANIDTLTGIKNQHAFLEATKRMNRQIEEQSLSEFAITILDVNDLKKTNDTKGHLAGDQCLLKACKLICDTFKHSPVFRVGGDEFIVVSQGRDYENIQELLDKVNEHNEKALNDGGTVVACGMAKYNNDANVAAVCERADKKMYENKKKLKEKK